MVRRLAVLFPLVLAGGCGLVLDLDPADPAGIDAAISDAGRPRDGGGSMDAGAGDGSTPPVDATVPPDDGGGVTEAGMADAARPHDAGTDAGPMFDAGACPPLRVGECDRHSDCASGEYCRHPLGECLERGTCQLRPTTCSPTPSPVCGCNGRTYTTACEAARDSTSVATVGTCPIRTWGGDWCGAATPSRDNLPCQTTVPLAPCFDDADCTGLFNACVGTTGCSSGDEGLCLRETPGDECYRDSACTAPDVCVGVEITPVSPDFGRCELP